MSITNASTHLQTSVHSRNRQFLLELYRKEGIAPPNQFAAMDLLPDTFGYLLSNILSNIRSIGFSQTLPYIWVYR